MAETLLITGGAGFIGSAFVRLAVASGYRAVVLDALTYAGHRANLERVECELVIGNVRDRALCDRLLAAHRPRALVHFAAESHVDNSIASPSEFIETNILGTYTLLEAVRAYLRVTPGDTFRYVQVSTDEVFGTLGPEGKFSETTPYAPNSPYSASKAAGDHLTRAWHHTYDLPTLITHCSNNYGPRQLPEKLIPVVITHALAGEKIPVYGDGRQVRDWIHVEDHCRGILSALENGRVGEHYCFGGDAECENIELVRTICAYLDEVRPASRSKSHADQIAFVPDRLGHDRRYAIDDRKSERELGFSRQWGLERGLRATVDWYLENQKWCAAVSTPSRPAKPDRLREAK